MDRDVPTGCEYRELSRPMSLILPDQVEWISEITDSASGS
jgi:hypothetical protein